MKRILQNGSLALLSIVVALLIFEGFLRLTSYGRMIGEDPLPPRDYYRSDALAGIDVRERAEKRTYRIKECEFAIWGNELGCFDEPYRGEDPFILLVGDSFSWGYVPLEQNWGKGVERQTGLRVLTCGVPGYGTKGEFLKARQVIQRAGRKPQLLIVGHFINDPIDDYLHPRCRVVEGYPLEARGIGEFSTGTIREKTEDTLREELENWQRYGVPERPRHPTWKRIKRFLNEHSVSYRLLQPPLSVFLEKATLAEGLRDTLVDRPAQTLALCRFTLPVRDRTSLARESLAGSFRTTPLPEVLDGGKRHRAPGGADPHAGAGLRFPPRGGGLGRRWSHPACPRLPRAGEHPSRGPAARLPAPRRPEPEAFP